MSAPKREGPVFGGVAVALITLFDERLEVDVAATTAHAERLVGLGISAVVVAGTTGEAAALTADERTALITSIRAAVADDVPVIAGTGAADARLAADLTARAADAGADAALALSPPLTNDPRRYYEAVAKAAPDLPLLAYHYPAVSAPGIPLDALRDLPVVGMKDSTGDAERLLAELDAWDRPVYSGSSALVSTAAHLGCPGVILALANAEPEGCVAAWDGGHGDGAAQRRLTASHLAQRANGGFPHGIKALTAAKFQTAAHSRMG
jgi:4-hydroxy-tetrahydrodipicolinate synthase